MVINSFRCRSTSPSLTFGHGFTAHLQNLASRRDARQYAGVERSDTPGTRTRKRRHPERVPEMPTPTHSSIPAGCAVYGNGCPGVSSLRSSTPGYLLERLRRSRWVPPPAARLARVYSLRLLTLSYNCYTLSAVRGTKVGLVPCERCAEACQSYIPQPLFKAAAFSGFCFV